MEWKRKSCVTAGKTWLIIVSFFLMCQVLPSDFLFLVSLSFANGLHLLSRARGNLARELEKEKVKEKQGSLGKRRAKTQSKSERNVLGVFAFLFLGTLLPQTGRHSLSFFHLVNGARVGKGWKERPLERKGKDEIRPGVGKIRTIRLLTPGLDNTRLFMSLTAGAGTRCMSLLSSSPSL